MPSAARRGSERRLHLIARGCAAAALSLESRDWAAGLAAARAAIDSGAALATLERWIERTNAKEFR